MFCPRKYVTYEDFGAKGDGISNDYPSIIAAHKYANENALEVRASDDAVYLILDSEEEAIIKTNTHFGNATFKIMDKDIVHIKNWIFKVVSSFEEEEVAISKIEKGQKNLPIEPKGKVYLRAFNDDKKVFIRKGLNASSGVSLNECLIVDTDGTLLTEPNFTFEKVTRATMKRIDDEPITLDGGHFITDANHQECKYNYHCRGIYVTRANVSIRNLTHDIVGEEEQGAPYCGFVNVSNTYNFTMENCRMTAHKTYYTESSAMPGNLVPMGTYDISFGATIKICLKNVTQNRAIMDKTYWGLMGSNFCRDFTMENCKMSRFDAHMGVTNAWIYNSEFGHQALSLIGYGIFHIENSTVYGKSFIRLRVDYGSTFEGKIEIKNCKLIPTFGPIEIIVGYNDESHDFGYECYMGKEITIDSLTIDDSKCPLDDKPAYIFNTTGAKDEKDRKYPYHMPEKIDYKGISCVSGRRILKQAE